MNKGRWSSDHQRRGGGTDESPGGLTREGKIRDSLPRWLGYSAPNEMSRKLADELVNRRSCGIKSVERILSAREAIMKKFFNQNSGETASRWIDYAIPIKRAR